MIEVRLLKNKMMNPNFILVLFLFFSINLFSQNENQNNSDTKGDYLEILSENFKDNPDSYYHKNKRYKDSISKIQSEKTIEEIADEIVAKEFAPSSYKASKIQTESGSGILTPKNTQQGYVEKFASKGSGKLFLFIAGLTILILLIRKFK